MPTKTPTSFFKLTNEYFLVFLISFFIILLPINAAFSILNLFDDQRVYQIALISLILLNLILNSFFRLRFLNLFFRFSLPLRFSLLILITLGIGSALLSPLIHYAFLELSLSASLFIVSLTIAVLFIQNMQVMQAAFLVMFIISSIFYQITFFSAYIASFIENIPLQWPEPFSGFSNIRFFNQYQLWLFFCVSAPLLIYSNIELYVRNILKINAIGWATLLFTSGSRGVVIAIFLSLAISGLIFKQRAFPFIKLNAWIVLSGFIGSLLLFKLLPLLLQSDVVSGWRTVDEIVTDSPRLYLWKIALDYTMAYPWLGIGPMHYAYYPNLVAMHPHNSVLQWAAEYGLPSVLILLALIGRGLLAWIKKIPSIQNSSPDNAKQPLWIVLFCTMSANLIYSLVDGVIVMPMSQTLMAIIAGWMFGVYFYANHPSKMTVSTFQNITALILVGASLITLIYTVMPDFIQKLEKQDAPLIMIPRFWQQGEILN